MTELFFITTYSLKPKNKKAQAAVEFCERYNHALVNGRISYDAIFAELKLLCKQLNESDTRTRELQVHRSLDDRFLTLRFQDDVHDCVFRLCFTKVQRTYQFSELISVAEDSLITE